MFRWLPIISHVFPGSGITVFTVWRTPLEWWRVYATQAEQWDANNKKK